MLHLTVASQLAAAQIEGMSFDLMMTGAFSRNIGKLFSELKLVADNLLSIYVLHHTQGCLFLPTPGKRV